MDERIRPGRWLYVIGALIIIAGIASFIFFLVSSITGAASANQQIVVPGAKDIVLDEPGKYTVFHEYRSVVGGKIYSNKSSIPGLRCKLIDKDTGLEVEFSHPFGSSRYSVGGREGVSVLEFSVVKPGTYEFSADYDNGDGPEVVLAIGRGFGGKILGTVFGGIAILFGSLIGGILILVITGIKRRKCKREMEQPIF